tara:strand:- start:15264 stop:16415 length:1152 start_codon:yes stop_codon:yes gene_type:complete
MSTLTFWTGSVSQEISGSTPFGIYDEDSLFQTDGPKIANWCARRLGFPIIDVELVDLNFYACFEEAVSEYGAQVNQFNIRNNLGSTMGKPTGSDLTHKQVAGSPLPNTIKLSESYGTYANVGGRTDVKKGFVETNANSQSYDLQTLWADVSESGKRIDITRVFHEGTPAITRFFDPYSVSGQGTLNLVDEFGFGSFSPAAQFMLMPIFEDIQRFQHIEFNDQIRKSAHTFNIVNNKLQIFPLPTGTYKLWFEYIVKDEYDSNSTVVQDGVVSDYSNIGYDFMVYTQINDVGKQWIRKYTLALAKELLGAVREKYSTVPIPGSEVSLDGAALRAEAQTEKDGLIEQLRANLEEVSNKVRYETEAENAENQQKLMTKVPINIYIG